MTIPRKGSRTINVDGVSYRWVVSTKGYRAVVDHWGNDEHVPLKLVLTVQEDKVPADSTLMLEVWATHVPSITPELAASFIRGAHRHGWQPTVKGPYRVGADEASKMVTE